MINRREIMGGLAVTTCLAGFPDRMAMADVKDPFPEVSTDEIRFFVEGMDLARHQAYAGFERCRMIVRHHEQNDPQHPNHARYCGYVVRYRTARFPSILPRYAKDMPPLLQALKARGEVYELPRFTMDDGTPLADYLRTTPMDADGIPL